MRVHKAFALSLVSAVIVSSCDSPTDVVIPHLDEVAPGTVLFFDDFDAENGSRGENNWTTFAQWNVVDGCVDLHGNGFIDVQAGNGLYVDLDGTCLRGGTIETKEAFQLPPGSYILEYWLAGNQRRDTPDTVHVALGSLYQEQFVLQRHQRFTLYRRTITVNAPSTVRLSFRNFGEDDEGALLDVVRLRRAD